jgi:hypothetical protein
VTAPRKVSAETREMPALGRGEGGDTGLLECAAQGPGPAGSGSGPGLRVPPPPEATRRLPMAQRGRPPGPRPRTAAQGRPRGLDGPDGPGAQGSQGCSAGRARLPPGFRKRASAPPRAPPPRAPAARARPAPRPTSLRRSGPGHAYPPWLSSSGPGSLRVSPRRSHLSCGTGETWEWGTWGQRATSAGSWPWRRSGQPRAERDAELQLEQGGRGGTEAAAFQTEAELFQAFEAAPARLSLPSLPPSRRPPPCREGAAPRGCPRRLEDVRPCLCVPVYVWVTLLAGSPAPGSFISPCSARTQRASWHKSGSKRNQVCYSAGSSPAWLLQL